MSSLGVAPMALGVQAGGSRSKEQVYRDALEDRTERTAKRRLPEHPRSHHDGATHRGGQLVVPDVRFVVPAKCLMS